MGKSLKIITALLLTGLIILLTSGITIIITMNNLAKSPEINHVSLQGSKLIINHGEEVRSFLELGASTSSMILFPVVVVIFGIALAINKVSSRDILALKRPKLRKAGPYFLAFFLLLTLEYFLVTTGYINEGDFRANVWENSNPYLLILGICILSPIAEEVIFRGYLFDSLLSRISWKPTMVAIGVTSLLFTVFHFQYSVTILAIMFVFAVLLGVIRLKTRSLYPVIALHMLNNILATIIIFI